MNRIIIKKIVNYSLLLTTVLMIISGYGISNYRLVESLTFGFLNKALAFKLHDFLDLFFIVLLLLHIFPFFRRKKIIN